MIRIGTSGYSFPDWRGRFYPGDIKPSDMFDFYVRMFDCVEINATHYRIPHRSSFERMNARSPGEFQFIVKTHQAVTHGTSLTREAVAHSMRELLHSVAPIRTSGKLRGLLAQFPSAFRNVQASREHLLFLKECSREAPLFVEFRDASWLGAAVPQFLERAEIGYVNVDEPALPGLLPPQTVTTTRAGYIRFHGRNASAWWGGDGTQLAQQDRYDYRYDEAELREWIDRIGEMEQRVDSLFLFFNNCARGQAAGDALTMRRLLGIAGPENPDITLFE